MAKIVKQQDLLFAVLIILGIICGFVGMQYPGLGYGDEGYQLLCIDYYRESPAGMLSYYIARGWQDVFGESVICMRVLASVMTTASIIVGCVFLWYRTRKKILCAGIFLGCVITSRISDFNLYNWETGSFLFASLSLMMLLSVLERPQSWVFFLTGVTLALTCMAKITMIAEIAIAVWVAVYTAHGNFRNGLVNVLYGLLGWVITVLAVTWLMTGGIIPYLRAFVPENITSGHALADWPGYLIGYVSEFPRQLGCWAPALLSLPVAVLMPRLSEIGKICTVILFVGVSGLTLWLFGNLSDYEYPLLGCGLPILIYVVFFSRIWKMLMPGGPVVPKTDISLWVILLFVVLIGVGSNRWQERCTIVYALPMAVGVIWPRLEDAQRNLMGRMLVIAFSAMTLMWGVRLAMQVRLSIYDGDKFPRCENLKLNRRIYVQLSEVSDAITRYESKGTDYVVVGDRYPALAIYGYDGGVPLHQFGQLLHDGPSGIERLRQLVEGRDAVIVVARFSDDLRDMERMLESEGFVSTSVGEQVRLFEKTSVRVENGLMQCMETDNSLGAGQVESIHKKVPQYFTDSIKNTFRNALVWMDVCLLAMGFVLIWRRKS